MDITCGLLIISALVIFIGFGIDPILTTVLCVGALVWSLWDDVFKDLFLWILLLPFKAYYWLKRKLRKK